MNKIFCIGANKTGTTSLKRQLIKYGLKTPLQIKHELLNKNISKGDFKALFELIIKFDFFQDSPFSQYPNFGCKWNSPYNNSTVARVDFT